MLRIKVSFYLGYAKCMMGKGGVCGTAYRYLYIQDGMNKRLGVGGCKLHVL